MHDDQDFRKTCLLQLLLNPLTLGALLFGALCIGESIVNYFHAREAVTLLGIFFLSLVIGFLAALILFGILHACWLNSYVEREVKQEFRERFCYTIFGCVLVLCTLITFFGCFGEVVGKTWDNMDIGVRNDEWASVRNAEAEKPKKQSTEHEASRATSTSSKDTHADTSSTSSHISSSYSPSIPSISAYPSTNNGAKYGYGSSSMNTPSGIWKPGDAEKAFDSQIGHVGREKLRQSQSEKKYGNSTSSSGYKSSDVFDAISNYRPSRSSSPDTRSAVSSETNTGATPHAKEEQKTIPVSERITDSDCECADDCEQEDFWITEEDDTTHNSSCARYGKGEGMYSAQGSGTDCPDCAGANGVSQKTDAPTSASASQQAPDKIIYWQSLDDGLVHHPSCSQYCNGRGYYTSTPTGKYCPKCGDFYCPPPCGGLYWITDVNGKTHNASCTWFGKYQGHYSTGGTGHNCQVCGGAQ